MGLLAGFGVKALWGRRAALCRAALGPFARPPQPASAPLPPPQPVAVKPQVPQILADAFQPESFPAQRVAHKYVLRNPAEFPSRTYLAHRPAPVIRLRNGTRILQIGRAHV